VTIGQAIQLNGVEALAGLLCRVYNDSGTFLAIMAYDSVAQLWRPKKVLADV
jgi:hypothetical protein